MILAWAVFSCASRTAEPPPVSAFEAAARRAEARVADDVARNGPPPAAGSSPLPPFTGVDRAVARYVGPGPCAACHPAATATWAGSGHARALAALVTARSSNDPRCIRCHVTGLGHPGGYPRRDGADLGAVGCEACHGPGSAHVTAPARGYGALPRGAAACVACHEWENSPDFRWSEYWPRVAH